MQRSGVCGAQHALCGALSIAQRTDGLDHGVQHRDMHRDNRGGAWRSAAAIVSLGLLVTVVVHSTLSHPLSTAERFTLDLSASDRSLPPHARVSSSAPASSAAPASGPYAPPEYPGYPPQCTSEVTADYFFEQCTLADPVESCKWSTELDCRYSSMCPWQYEIACDTWGGAQRCTWYYRMACAQTVPPLPSCPWTYNMTCF